MKLLVVVILSACALISAEEAESEYPSAFNYHAKYGLQRANEIRALEAQIQAQKIVGGFEAPINAYPYQAGLVIDLLGVNGNSVCGGSLLTVNRVMTAAHCWFDGVNQAWRFTVVLGSSMLFSGGTRLPTTTVTMHSSYDTSFFANDVAIVSLPYQVTLTSQISTVALPTGTAAFEDFTGSWAIASGYGKTLDTQAGVSTSTVLSAVTLQVTTNAICTASFGNFVRDSTLCTLGTGGVGICGGDSGGPLVLARNGVNILIGVSSFVAASGCQRGFPSAFGRVTSHLNWIYNNL